MIEQLKASKEIKVHLKSGQGHFVVGNKLTSFNLNEIDDVETVKYIIEKINIIGRSRRDIGVIDSL